MHGSKVGDSGKILELLTMGGPTQHLVYQHLMGFAFSEEGKV